MAEQGRLSAPQPTFSGEGRRYPEGVLQVREAALDRARLLNRLTLGWNVVEGVIAIAAGVAAWRTHAAPDSRY